MDEVFLIGDRNSRVESRVLAQEGKWEEMLKGEKEGEGDGGLAGDLCVPRGGSFYFRNAVQGVTDWRMGGKRFLEGSAPGLVVPD